MSHNVLLELTRGDSPTFRRSVTGVDPSDLLAQAWMTVKLYPEQPYASALLKLVITTASDPQGQITDTGASGTGVLYFFMTAAQTRALVGTWRFPYDIQVKTADGLLTTVEDGWILIRGEVTEVDV